MKTSVKESFDRELCLRALDVRLSFMLSDVNEYINCMNDVDKPSLPEKNLSGICKDAFVQHIFNVRFVLLKWQETLRGIIGDPDSMDEAKRAEAYNFSLRYQEYNLHYKRSKSYDSLKVHFERALASYIHVIYRYACMLSLKGYIIPPGFERQFLHGGGDYLWLLDSNDTQVGAQIAFIKELEIPYYRIMKNLGDKKTILTFTFPSFRKLYKKLQC